jgi:hypothetical protein
MLNSAFIGKEDYEKLKKVVEDYLVEKYIKEGHHNLDVNRFYSEVNAYVKSLLGNVEFVLISKDGDIKKDSGEAVKIKIYNVDDFSKKLAEDIGHMRILKLIKEKLEI